MIDEVTIIVRAGNGGNGAVSFLRNGQTSKGGPDGGNGGNGGDIYIQGTHNETDLHEFQYKKKVLAPDGIAGKKSNLFGRNGEDIVIHVPMGTQVTDLQTDEEFEVTLETPVLIAKGGIGGKGNTEFKSATNQAPKYAEPGGVGQARQIRLNLKLIASIGLVGLPNAGKSSLLAVLTHAQPKIGAYPFTTLDPNIGMLEGHPIADIPGLIEGASDGKGLGVRFLKHIEKTKILVHCIDSSIANPLEAYNIIRGEFKKYSPVLVDKPEIILLTKTDLIDQATKLKVITSLSKTKREIKTISSFNEEQVKQLRTYLVKIVEQKT